VPVGGALHNSPGTEIVWKDLTNTARLRRLNCNLLRLRLGTISVQAWDVGDAGGVQKCIVLAILSE
jgi:hypothetical protein